MESAGLVSIVISVSTFLCCAPGINANVGSSFLIIVSKEPFNFDVLLLSVTLVDSRPSRVNVTAPKRTDVLNESFMLGTDGTFSRLINVNESLYANESTKYNDIGIWVQSEYNITVLVISDMYYTIKDSQKVSSCAFLALPTDQLSTSYVAWTQCEVSECFITVASFLDDTNVEIQLSAVSMVTHTSSPSIQYRRRLYNDGSVINEKINAFESFQLLGYTVDMTGTRVTSDRPVAVVCGGVFGTISHEYLLNNAYHYLKQDKTIEQIPPLESFGMSFVLRGPWSGNSTFPVYIVTPYPDTHVNISHNAPVVEGDDFKKILYLPDTQTTSVVADKPILVVSGLTREYLDDVTTSLGLSRQDMACNQYYIGEERYLPNNVDPSMTLAMPTNMWRYSYQTSIVHLKGTYSTHTIVVMTSRNCHGRFLINSKYVDASQWCDEGVYKTGIIAIQRNSTHITESRLDITNAHCVFGGYVVGGSPSDFKTWAYPLGWSNQILDWKSTTVAPALHTETTSSVTTGQSATTNDPTGMLSTNASDLQQQNSSTIAQTTLATVDDTDGTTPSTCESNTLSLCRCKCTRDFDRITNITRKENEERMNTMIRQLRVDKSSISQTLRRKNSAKNRRQSSAYLGSLTTGLVMITVIAFIVVPDIFNLVKFIRTVIQRIK